MRERLLAAFIGMTVLFLALYGVPRAYILADFVEEQERRKVERTADVVAAVLSEQVRQQEPVSAVLLRQLLHEGEGIRYEVPGGSTVQAGQRGLRPDADVVVDRPVVGGGSVTISRSGDLVQQRISNALLPLVLIGLGLVAASTVTAFLLARGLARPFQDLARLARRLGTGHFDLQVPRYRIPEAEAIGTALQLSARELDALIRREREFASNASHQLRTPITALRLELEDLSLRPTTPPEVTRELVRSLNELDRLTTAVSQLLDMARGQRMGAAVDLDLADVVRSAVLRWRPLVAEAGRRIEDVTRTRVPARLLPGPVNQILDVLIDNAIKHGRGRVTVEAVDVDTHLQVRLADQGSRTFGTEVFRRHAGSVVGGEGVGLTVADELADAIGGRLEIDAESSTTAFILLLPRPAGAVRGTPDTGSGSEGR